MNFIMNLAPVARSIARPVDQQSNVLPLSYGCPRYSSSEMCARTDDLLSFCAAVDEWHDNEDVMDTANRHEMFSMQHER